MLAFDFSVEAKRAIAQLEKDDAKLNQSPRPLLEDLGKYVEDKLRGYLEGGSGPDGFLRDRSQTAKEMRPGGTTLRHTGELLRSIRVLGLGSSEVRIGSSLPQAGLLNFGGTTASTSAIPGKRVPARTFIGLGDDVIRQVVEDVEAYYLGAAR